MRKQTLLMMAAVPALLLSVTACSSNSDGGRVVIKESGSTITVVERAAPKAGGPEVAVESIDRVGDVEITDWLDEKTIIVSKENEALDRMKLAELSELYPKSLYAYSLTSKQYKLLKEKPNTLLGGAVLSPDKKHLLYHEFDLGDPVYYVLNLDTLKSFGLIGQPIGGAVSARWTANGTIVGASYSSGIYEAQTSGDIGLIPGLEEEGLFIARKVKDKVYYNTQYDGTLKQMDLTTKEKTSLKLDQVYDLIPSPDENLLLALQYRGSKATMIVYDTIKGTAKTIVEGTELGGVSWSPDQRMIAYRLSADTAGASANGLYVYDMLSGDSTQIAVDLNHATTVWSPSGNALAYTEWKGYKASSSIVHLKYSIR
ncbi:hypothetical protein [Cohnella boryungensis]|uniref:TolB protein n=1 Tax=Cohnella boryungensis TaxID=768479 RepID=A0ABV8SGT5_9BACL